MEYVQKKGTSLYTEKFTNGSSSFFASCKGGVMEAIVNDQPYIFYGKQQFTQNATKNHAAALTVLSFAPR